MSRPREIFSSKQIVEGMGDLQISGSQQTNKPDVPTLDLTSIPVYTPPSAPMLTGRRGPMNGMSMEIDFDPLELPATSNVPNMPSLSDLPPLSAPKQSMQNISNVKEVSHSSSSSSTLFSINEEKRTQSKPDLTHMQAMKEAEKLRNLAPTLTIFAALSAPSMAVTQAQTQSSTVKKVSKPIKSRFPRLG